MMTQIELFEKSIFEEEPMLLDPEGLHQEFVSGVHGQKADFDKIETGSPRYIEWVDVTEDYIRETYPELPDIFLGVADGTNRLALDVARRFDGEVIGLKSVKKEGDSKTLLLPEKTRRIIRALMPKLVLVLEDVGTTGFNSVQVAQYARSLDVKNIEVVHTLQRRPKLERLEAAGVPYRSLILRDLPTYTEEDCLNLEDGFCRRGWEFIPRNK